MKAILRFKSLFCVFVGCLTILMFCVIPSLVKGGHVYASENEVGLIEKLKKEELEKEQQLLKEKEDQVQSTELTQASVPLTMQNLAKLYWSLGMLDVNNPVHVDNFLKITECNLYEEFYHNEFEWREIRKAGMESLSVNIQKFPKLFHYIQPIIFENYDFEKQEFPLHISSKLDQVYRFEALADNLYDTSCTADKGIKNYPMGLILEYNRPVSIHTISVPQDLAQTFVDFKTKDLSEKQKSRARQREKNLRGAYIVMTFEVLHFKEIVPFNVKYKLANVFAKLHSYEIYGDINQEILLYKKRL